jgi:NADP-dependent 3-hydroxy acid dehydrogenase YdfG
MSNLEAARLFSVKGLVAVVTGAGSGLGEVMANALDVNGAAKVFILGRRESKLGEVAFKAVRHIITFLLSPIADCFVRKMVPSSRSYAM